MKTAKARLEGDGAEGAKGAEGETAFPSIGRDPGSRPLPEPRPSSSHPKPSDLSTLVTPPMSREQDLTLRGLGGWAVQRTQEAEALPLPPSSSCAKTHVTYNLPF